jgi:phosphomevalonate kinase
MDGVDFSAPGKLVLFGEYAVLFGAPAVVAAVGRRARVSLRPSADESWEVSAPGFSLRPARFEIEPGGGVRWHDEELGRGTFGLIEKLLGGIQGSTGVDLEALPATTMTLDTRPFFEDDAKLGLGSSAALTVALASALESYTGMELVAGRRGRLEQLVNLHRAVQGGAGSGIDIAASLLGGVIRYRLTGDGSVADAMPLDLPGTLRMVFVWTGRAASTGDFLGRLRARRQDEPGVVNPVLDELGTVSSAGVAALAAADSESFLEQVEAFWIALDQLGTVIGMPILSKEHRAIRRVAEDCGVRYKPSGAGGGDFGVGFTTDPSAAAKLADRVALEGFRALDLHVDATGLAGPGT